MSLDKAIKYGKEYRKPYTGGKKYFNSCRNRGNCAFCMGNRLHKFRDKHPETMEEAIEATTEFHERSCPDCGNNLFMARVKDNRTIYICTYCGLQMWTNEEDSDANSAAG